MVKHCKYCQEKAHMFRHKDKSPLCKNCFLKQFQMQVHFTIVQQKLFSKGEVIAVGASGGKDSTVLVHVLNKLNKQMGYGVQIVMVSVDQGIVGYRDDSLQCVKRNQQVQKLPLIIISYKQMFGWTMDQVVAQIGQKHNCTYCGIFRRRALQVGAIKANANKIITGHNADDIAQTVLLNLLRGDHRRLSVCAQAITGGQQQGQGISGLPRARPFKMSFQKDIVLYAHYAQLDYFSTQCVYSKFAFRGQSREFIKQIYSIDPLKILNMIKTASRLTYGQSSKRPIKQCCNKCGMMSSSSTCKACKLLQGLQKGRPKIKIKKQQKKQF